MFPYAVVEGAMAEFFGVRPSGQPALRSRIRNLQRLGLMPSGPKEGGRILYTRYDVYDLALSLSLAEIGIEPKNIVGSHAENVFRDLDRAGTLHREEFYCAFYPTYFTTGKSIFQIETWKTLQASMKRQPRAALVNISDIVRRISKSLEA